MKTKVYDAIFEYYKNNYTQIEKRELYKWKAVVHFQENWNIEADDFSKMLDCALSKTRNLLGSANYYPRKLIIEAAKVDEEKTRNLFRILYDLSLDLKERIEAFRMGVNEIIENSTESGNKKSYQDHRAIMVYLNMRYPEQYYLYKYGIFVTFSNLIDYAELPKKGTIDLVFMYESMCDMILGRVLEDKEILGLYEDRRSKHYDPAYHLLVQDIVYSAKRYAKEASLETDEVNKEIVAKQFDLKPIIKPIQLKGSHVDYIQKAKDNKRVGDAGEEFIYQRERNQVKEYNLKNKTVRRVSKVDGDGLGYDILSYDENGIEKYIEVKTTTGKKNSSFYITANELKMSEEHPEQYYLYRVYDFDLTSLNGEIEMHKGSLRDLCITPQIYKVDFQ